MASKKTCYIISQIGKPESNEREWANFIRDNIIEPVVTECDYEVPARADDPEKDLIMIDIIEQMFTADLVIADLTDYNPNVFYELGLRHCSQKPAIHLIRKDQSPPFDLGGNKAIFISKEHLDVIQAREDIKGRIKAIEKNPKQFFSHVQLYIQLKNLNLFKETQTGKDEVIVNGFLQLIAVFKTLSETQKELYEELVEKPKRVRAELSSPSYGLLKQIAMGLYNEPPKHPIIAALEEIPEKKQQ